MPEEGNEPVADNYVVSGEGNFNPTFMDGLDEGVKGSLEGVSNINDLITNYHEMKSAPPTQTTINGLADDKGMLKDEWWNNYDDLKDNPSLKNFKSVEGLAKSLVNANKMVGKKLLPGEFASDEQRAEFYKNLGVPETIEEYGFKQHEDHPEGVPYNEENDKWFANIAKKNNLTKEQASAIREDYYNLMKDSVMGANSEMEQQVAMQKEALKTKWGENHEKNLEIASKALDELEKTMPSDAPKAADFGLNDHPGFAEYMYNLAQGIGEDSLITVDPRGSGMTKQDVQDKVAELQAHEGYLNPSHAEHKAIHNKITEYFKMLHPE